MSRREVDLNRLINPFTVWDERAKIPGLRSVMSLGLDESRAGLESEKLVSAVFSFIDRGIKGKDVLEIGTGIGRFTKQISLQSASLTTLDLSQAMLRRAKDNCNGARNLNFLKGSGDHIPTIDGRFDWVFEVTVLLHMPDEQFRLILQESRRVLRPDGKLFLCGPINPEERRQIHQYTVHRTLVEYQEALSPFKIQTTGNVKCGEDNYTMIIAG